MNVTTLQYRVLLAIRLRMSFQPSTQIIFFDSVIFFVIELN